MDCKFAVYIVRHKSHMTKKSNNKIEIHKVEGDVVISQDQKGGSTSHTTEKIKISPNRKWTIISLIVFASSVVTILAYFGIQFSSNQETIKPAEVNQVQINADTMINKQVEIPQIAIKGNKMLDKKEEKPINIGKVEGDVIISQNQSGGITAKNIEINTDRRIDKTNFDFLVDGLKNNQCVITVGVLGNGGEPSFLADQLLLAATQSGCKVSGVNHGVGFEPFMGVKIIYSTINTPVNSISIIESVFNKANITYIKIPDDSKTGSIYLYVGYKP